MRNLDPWTAEKIEADLTRQSIDAYTKRRLEETLRYAVENSAFYREKYGTLFSDLKRFEKLPFTTPRELQERGMEFLCVKPGEISRVVTLDTGGTTGIPKRICFTEEDQQLTVDYFCHGMQLMADSSDNVLILMPARVPGSIGKLLAKGLRAFGAKAVEYGLPGMKVQQTADEELEGCAAEDAGTGMHHEAQELLALMEREGITGVVALPTHMRMLAESLYSSGRTSGLSLKFVLLSAEYVPQEDALLIGETFGCKVYEHYGMTEMGLGCAVSCGHGRGYHVREGDLYLEIIDPVTGGPMPPGEYGEIVFTTLTRKGMPFIRYRTGDFSRWLTEPCGCGSILKRLDKVGPRDMIKGYLK